MKNSELKIYYNKLKKYDASYCELFYEETTNKNYYYLNNKLEDIMIEIINGVGITLNDKEKSYYGSTNNFADVDNIIGKLCENFNVREYEDDVLVDNVIESNKSQNGLSDEEKKMIMNEINEYSRNFDKRINQVIIRFNENEQNVKILSNNKFNVEKRLRTRVIVTVFAEENNKVVNSSLIIGYGDDYSFLDTKVLMKKLEQTCKETIEKFDCVSFEGGKVPVVISNDGAVIFHEACGHAMESYSIANKTSVLTDMLNKKIASDKVTIIDDGTKGNLFGTSIFDDQGTKTKNNVLIKNGILKEYLTDNIDAVTLNSSSTGSARRESYKNKAISRMNNTYLEIGNDKVEDMIKSIDYGIYAKKLGGGSVSPNTGEFNFNVTFGYIIKDGKIDKPIKNVSLIGSALDILSNVEMVSDDLDFSTGYCGAESGNVPVTLGQPTIKVSKILVGGSNE